MSPVGVGMILQVRAVLVALKARTADALPSMTEGALGGCNDSLDIRTQDVVLPRCSLVYYISFNEFRRQDLV